LKRRNSGADIDTGSVLNGIRFLQKTEAKNGFNGTLGGYSFFSIASHGNVVDGASHHADFKL
jgi:hypothetical protein